MTSPAAGDTKDCAKEKRSAQRTILEYVILAVAAVAVALLIQAFLIKPYRIPTASMEDTLLIGDRVLVDRISWRFSDPARGDVVVFHSPLPGPVLIKRIVGMPGALVSLKDGSVYIDGRLLDEPYVRVVNGQKEPTQPFSNGRPWALQSPYKVPRQLLPYGRQPHEQRGQPRLRPRHTRRADRSGVRAALAAPPHRRAQLATRPSGVACTEPPERAGQPCNHAIEK